MTAADLAGRRPAGAGATRAGRGSGGPGGRRSHQAGRVARLLRDDGGSATVWAALVSGVILAVGLVGVDLASGVRARHVAESAADMAALAAAGHSVEGADAACPAARAVAGRSGAVVRGCRLDGWDALVEVEVDRRWTLLGRGPAGARARAGPVPVTASTPAPGRPSRTGGPVTAPGPSLAEPSEPGRAARAGSSAPGGTTTTDE